MKKSIWVLSIFFATFTIGYFVVPNLTKSIEKKSVPPDADEKILVLPKSPNQDFTEEFDVTEDFERKFKIKLLETGEGFHGDQVNARSGETWLGLFYKNNRFYLERTKIHIERVVDIVVDEEKKNEKTGKTVKTDNKNPSVFLLRNADFLKEGDIKTFFGGTPNADDIEENKDYFPLKIGFSKDFILDGEKYTLSLKKGINRQKERIIVLVLENRKNSQILHSLKYFDENDYLGTLHWVGDLDRDNKPDFYFDLYIHDNVEDRYLFLSSKAKKGKHVEKVGNFWTNGC